MDVADVIDVGGVGVVVDVAVAAVFAVVADVVVAAAVSVAAALVAVADVAVLGGGPFGGLFIFLESKFHKLQTQGRMQIFKKSSYKAFGGF